MGYMNEFPHSRMFDSDLREILEFFNSLAGLPEEVVKLRKYITELDLQDAVNKKIDDLISEGKFNEILTTLFDTLGYVTPEMFGAKGDGVSDDTIAIQTAIDNYHKIVFNKVYGFTQIVLKSDLELLGGGKLLYLESPIERRAYYPIVTPFVEGNKNIYIHDLTFDGNIKNVGLSDNVYIVCDTLTISGDNIKIMNCHFVNTIDSAIMFSMCTNSEVAHNTIEGGTDCGIYVNANGVDNGMYMFNIHDNIFKNNGTSAIALKRVTGYGIVNNNLISGSSGGITLEHASTATDYSKQIDICNNYMRGLNGYGINVRGGYNHNIIANRIEECSETPILIDQVTNVNCNDNIIVNTSVHSQFGVIKITTRDNGGICKNINIANNIIVERNGELTSYGILFYSLISATYENINVINNIVDVDGNGLHIQDGHTILNFNVIGNTIDTVTLPENGVNEVLFKDNATKKLSRGQITMIDKMISYGNIIKRTYISNQRALANNYFFKRYDTLILTDNYEGDVMLIANNDGLGSEVLIPCITLN